MPITLLDGILIIVVLISAVLAMIRGFTREVFSIASWVAAAAVAYFFWGDLLPYVQRYVDDRNLALGITVAGIFFVTLLVVSIITMRVSDFVLDSRAGPVDRILGFAFGAARGVILVIIAVLFVNFFIAPDKQPEWIAMAKSKPWLELARPGSGEPPAGGSRGRDHAAAPRRGEPRGGARERRRRRPGTVARQRRDPACRRQRARDRPGRSEPA